MLGLAFWAGQFASQVTDGHSVYQDMVRYSRYVTTLHDQEPVSFQRLNPKSTKSKLYNLDSLEINEMEEAIEEEAKDDPRYLQDIVAAAIVITTRIPNSEISEDSTKMSDFVAICEDLIHWALTNGQEDEITNECQDRRQSYIYQVLQTIQMKLILLCVWAEPAVLGRAKTALKIIYKI